MIARLLVALSAGIILALGAVHLLYTFRGSRLHPRDVALMQSMQAVSPVISRETTMWKCWIGFNASHSLAAMLFGLVYGYLAVAQPDLLFHSPFLLFVAFAMLVTLTWLGKTYWFSVPFRGIAGALVLFCVGVLTSAMR